ncbi:MAG: ABC transporter transmembrane domain-containing protein [Alphaproteobacteria bacterium]|nr:ABC transporter transmembrane domain-containing protein [Alphaproteobacteria bacterium]
MVLTLVIHLLALALPLSLLQIYDRILPAQSFGTAAYLVLGVGVAVCLEAVLRYGRSTLLASAAGRYEARTTMALLDRVERADVHELERHGPTTIAEAFRAVGQVRDFWAGQAGTAVYELPFAALYIALIAYLAGWLALIPLGLFACVFGLAVIVGVRVSRAAQETERAAQERQFFSWSLFAALEYLKCVGAEESLAALWRRINRRFMSRSADLEAKLGWIRETASTVGQLATVLVVAFGALEVIDGAMTTGALAACTMLAGRSIGPAVGSLSHWSQIGRVRSAEERIRTVLTVPEAPIFTRETAPDGPAVETGAVRIEAPGLLPERISIAAGEIVHIDTPDTPLASRLLTAVAGVSADPEFSIQVDGRDVTSFDPDAYRDAVILVSSHLALVPGSILNNLTLYDPRYNIDVAPLCEALGLQPHLDRLRHGVLTEVGPDNAEHLDEGIYQRIALIRALVRRPKLLLLDHAASGLDLDGLDRLATVLAELRGETTILLASFKEPLVSVCDRTLFLEAEEESHA